MGPGFESLKVHQRVLTRCILQGYTEVGKLLTKGKENFIIQFVFRSDPDDIELVLIRVRVHLFPFRTQ